MHTGWSDGSASILEMAQAARERGYGYIAITDHSKGLKIAGGIDEKALAEQGREIAGVNGALRGSGLTVLRSIEMNLNPRGEGDMDSKSLGRLDVVLGAFIPRCERRKTRRRDTSRRSAIPTFRSSAIRAAGFIIIALG
jgi:DNA polymerase (family 10)